MKLTKSFLLASVLICCICLIFAVGCAGDKGTDEIEREDSVDSCIVFDQDILNLQQGETYRLEPKIEQSMQAYRVWWSMEDESIAVVDENGMVTAIAPGVTRCFAQCGMDIAICEISVSEKPNYGLLLMMQDEYDLNTGDKYPVSSSVTVRYGAEFVTDYTLTCTSSDTNIVRFESGNLIGVAEGKTTVMVTVTVERDGESLTAQKFISVGVWNR